jgi:hypothetical protein
MSFIIILFCAYSACISVLSCILELKEVKRTTKCKEHLVLRIQSKNMEVMLNALSCGSFLLFRCG